jgi:hypothetical protein
MDGHEGETPLSWYGRHDRSGDVCVSRSMKRSSLQVEVEELTILPLPFPPSPATERKRKRVRDVYEPRKLHRESRPGLERIS